MVMKLLNIFFVLIITALSVLPLLAPQKADYLYTYFHDIASGKIACHCDAMKDMEESVQKSYANGQNFAYIIDCNSTDKQTRDHSNQLRTSVSTAFSPDYSTEYSYIYPHQIYPIHTRTLSLETPPPRYCA